MPVHGQERPQLVWKGAVQGLVTLYIKGKRVEAEEKGGSITQQHFRFRHGLPEGNVHPRLEKIEGRGYVQVVEPPHADNNYTLVVRIEDRQGGSAPYSLAFYWDDNRMENSRELSGGGRLKWKGRIHDEVIVSCHESTCEASAISGSLPLREDYKFSKPLPLSDVEVNLEKIEGRGEIRLLDPPLEKNGYTARVLIRDRENGASDYSFTLTWGRPIEREVPAGPQLGLMWRGRVDGRVRVSVRGGAVASHILDGKPVIGQTTDFYQTLPSRSDLNVTLKKLNGRGEARIIELPSSQNHFELLIEIDSSTGADDYQIEVDW